MECTIIRAAIDWLDKIADELENQIEEVARLETTNEAMEVALNVDASRS